MERKAQGRGGEAAGGQGRTEREGKQEERCPSVMKTHSLVPRLFLPVLWSVACTSCV